MNRIKIMACAAMLITMAGCASQKSWTSVGGSRADGSVELGYTVGMFEKPVVSTAQGDSTAASVCQRWGYDSAEPFGMSNSKCQRRDMYGSCIETLVTKQWQCITDEDTRPESVQSLGPVKLE